MSCLSLTTDQAHLGSVPRAPITLNPTLTLEPSLATLATFPPPAALTCRTNAQGRCSPRRTRPHVCPYSGGLARRYRHWGCPHQRWPLFDAMVLSFTLSFCLALTPFSTLRPSISCLCPRGRFHRWTVLEEREWSLDDELRACSSSYAATRRLQAAVGVAEVAEKPAAAQLEAAEADAI